VIKDEVKKIVLLGNKNGMKYDHFQYYALVNCEYDSEIYLLTAVSA
jgi:hypothetical protein